ncbi:hypothetical protein O0I10_009393 [Lichtheimia ornata]|uniref:RING-type domain-containing protein n=1 Tax=Lichtheimia ornata TaxID=688661 RepID=A0AAD7XYS9_9FUNG|nr:uncharacterized protein O0I10_009393 [Lichtheimia ornata]KAJ8654997.1 hypothetical protein O0I10_009393 [Lichtheimia ornata]
MNSLLQCAACKSRLYEPVTLSCGYTICSSCTQPPSSDATVFVCPAKQCHQPTHLFARNQVAHHVDSTLQRIIEAVSINGDIKYLLCCPHCHDTLCEPVTTQCGHTCCYGCMLKLKCQGKSCTECQSPLPHYSYLNRQASINRLLEQIVRFFAYPKIQQQVVRQQHEYRSPLFTTGSIILPRQRTHFSLFKSSDLHLLEKALLYSNGSLYLPVIHHVRSSTPPRYGTLIQVIGVEERYSPITGKAILLNVRGRERIKVSDIEQVMEDGMAIMVATYGLVPVNAMDNCDIVRTTACDIEMRIRQLAAHDTTTTTTTMVSKQQSHPTLTTHVAGLLGRKWLEDMQQQQGLLPSPAKPDSLVWWVAVALPISVEQRYRLLCSESLQHRLHLVLSWITQLSSQWQYCRRMANQALATVFDQQPYNKML